MERSSTSPPSLILWKAQKKAALQSQAAEKQKTKTGTSYRDFQSRYRDDPVAFVRDCFTWNPGDSPAPYQCDILAAIVTERRVCVRGPHSMGKSATAAWIILWFALTRDGRTDWKVPITASAWRQLTHFLMPEVHKWARRLCWDRIGREPFSEHELLTLNLKLSTGEAFALASDNSALIEGAHATELIFVFDESKAIPDATWDSAEGALSSKGTYALAISTPGEPQGRFYAINVRKAGTEDWWVRHVTLQEALDAGRIELAWTEGRKRLWGEDSALYANRVLGEFHADDEAGVIPLSWIEAAIERWHIWHLDGAESRMTGLGVDVGGGLEGSDASVIAPVYDIVKVGELRKYTIARDPHSGTMELVGHVAGIMQANRRIRDVFIDIIGVGAGVVHRLREEGFRVQGYNASMKTGLCDKSGELGFANWRSAGWWVLRELLEPGSNFNVCLPPDDQLIGELTAPHYRVTSGRLIQVESKEDVKKRIGRSTDSADAVIHALAGPSLALEQAGPVKQVRYETNVIDARY